MMGMTYEQYWDGDTDAHKAYRKAHKLKLAQKNQLAWLQAMYVYEALIDVTPYLKAFSKSRPRPFRDSPYELFEDERREREEREQRERYFHMRDKVAAFAKAFNEKQQNLRKSEVDDDARCIPERD